MSDSIRKIKSQVNFISSDLRQKNWDKANSRIAEIESLLAPLLAENPDNSELLELQKRTDQAKDDIQKGISEAQFLEKFNAAKKLYNFLGSKIRTKNFDQADKDSLEALSILDGLDQSDSRVIDLRKKIEEERVKFANTVKDDELKGIIASITSKKNSLDRNIKGSNNELKMQLLQEIEGLANDLKIKFPDNCEPVYSQTITYLEKVGEDIKSLGLESLAKDVVGKGNNILSSLKRALESKRIEDCIKYKGQLQEEISRVETSSAKDHSLVKEFLSKAQIAIDQLNNSIGPLIAEKEIDMFIPQLNKEISALKRCVDSKSISKIPGSKKAVEDTLAKLLPHKGNNKVDEAIKNAQDYLTKVDTELGELVTKMEIEEATKVINSSLSALERDISNLNISGILKNKDRVRSLAAPVMKYSSHPSAKTYVDRINTVFNKLENELPEKLAEEKSKSIKQTLDGYYKLLEKSASSNDNNSVLTYLKKVYSVIYPLQQEYPNQNITKAILSEADSIGEKVGAASLLSPFENLLDSTIQKVQPTFENFKKEAANPSTSLSVLQTQLTNINNEVLSLRTNFIPLPKARSFLIELDNYNRKYLGGIPGQSSDKFPSFEVNPLVPQKIQKALKDINAASEKANKKLNELLSLTEIPEGTMDSSSPFRFTVNTESSIEREVDVKVDRANNFIRDIESQMNKIKGSVSVLENEDPENPAISLCKKSIEDADDIIKSSLTTIKTRWRYAHYIRWAVFIMDEVEQADKEYSTNFQTPCRSILSQRFSFGSSSYSIKPNQLYSKYVTRLLSAESALQASIYGMNPEDYPEYDRYSSRFNELKTRIQNDFLEVHRSFACFYQAGGFFEDANEWHQELKGFFQDEYVALEKRLQEIKQKREEAIELVKQKHEELQQLLTKCASQFLNQLSSWSGKNLCKAYDNLHPMADNYDCGPYINRTKGQVCDMVSQDKTLIKAIKDYDNAILEKWNAFLASVYKKYELIPYDPNEKGLRNAQPLIHYNPYSKGKLYTVLGGKIEAMTTETKTVKVNGVDVKIEESVPFYYQLNIVKGIETPQLVAFLDSDSPKLQNPPDCTFINPLLS